jgi:hypothetical protein
MKKSKLRIPLTILILVCFCASSCGVMFGGSRYSGSIAVKDHPNASIAVNGNVIGKGTAVGSFKRDKPLTVTISEPGCKEETKTFDNTFRTGNFILSVVSWGLIGIIVDLGTGAAYKPDHTHDPKIEQMSSKNFVFNVDYTGCSGNVAGSNE